MSHSSMSAAELSLQYLLCPFGEIGVSLEGREEGQVSCAAGFADPVADQLEGGPQLLFGKLVHQVMELFTHRAHVDQCTDKARDSPASALWHLRPAAANHSP